jgi:glycosyltransferase involved in cell wall biosynthesis
MMTEPQADAPSRVALPPARVLVNALALRPQPNGARFFLERLIAHLPEVWPAAELVVLVQDDVELSADAAELVRVPVRGASAGRVLRELVELPNRVNRLGIDVVIGPNESIPARLRVPVVVVAQNLLFHCPDVGPLPTGPLRARLKSRAQFAYYRRQMPRAYRRADAVVAVSAHAARVLSLRAGLDLEKVTVASCGADRLPLRERNVLPGRRRIVIVGAIAHYKRLDKAVDALARLERSGAEYELVLAGEEWPGYAAIVEERARRQGMEHRVHRLGGLSDEALADLLAGAHVVLSLSRCESFGIPIVEAMRAGVPAVVPDEPWSTELAEDAAIRVDANDPAAVAAGIRRLEDAAEWQLRSKLGREVADRYVWRATAAAIARAAASVVAGVPKVKPLPNTGPRG